MPKNGVLGDSARFGLPADQGSAGRPSAGRSSAGGVELMASLVLLLVTRHGEGLSLQFSSSLFFVPALRQASCSDQVIVVTTPCGSETCLPPLARPGSTGVGPGSATWFLHAAWDIQVTQRSASPEDRKSTHLAPHSTLVSFESAGMAVNGSIRRPGFASPRESCSHTALLKARLIPDPQSRSSSARRRSPRRHPNTRPSTPHARNWPPRRPPPTPQWQT